jgi:hypothetical protein
MKLRCAVLVGLVATPYVSAGTPRVDVLLSVDRFDSTSYEATLDVASTGGILSEVRLAFPGEPTVPFVPEGDDVFFLDLLPDATLEEFLTDPADGEVFDIQFVLSSGGVSVYRFIAADVVGPQIDLATLPGFATGVAFLPGSPAEVQWTPPSNSGGFLLVSGEPKADDSGDDFFLEISPPPLDPLPLIAPPPTLTLGQSSFELPAGLADAPFEVGVGYAAVLGVFEPVHVSGPTLDLASTAGILISVASGTFAPTVCLADLAEPFGLLDLADIVAFVGAFGTQDPAADFDGNGLFDLADIIAFVDAFAAGCP